jgi:hypothetical protein
MPGSGGAGMSNDGVVRGKDVLALLFSCADVLILVIITAVVVLLGYHNRKTR